MMRGAVVVVPERFPRLRGLADFWIAVQMRAALVEHRLDAFLSPNTKLPLTRRAVFTTVHEHAVHLHTRTLQPGDEDDVVRAVEHALAT